MSRSVDDLVQRLPILEPTRPAIEEAIELLTRSLRSGGKLLVCGNGGSASDSEHLVADLMKGFMSHRSIPAADVEALRRIAGTRGERVGASLQGGLPAISLASECALTTAIANDIRFDMIFAQRVYALGRPGDVLFVLSTSGNSPSVVNAAVVARLRAMPVIVLTGREGGEAALLSDIAVRVPADRVFEIQDLHLPVYHAIALALEQRFFPEPGDAESTCPAPVRVEHAAG